jgi:hypothetical protein
VQTQQYNTGGNRPWLDQTCYDDDHGWSFVAEGWLAAGETWTLASPLAVCSDKLVKLHARWAKRVSPTTGLADYGGHDVPTRYVGTPNEVDAYACNTDLGVMHVQLLDDGPGLDQPLGYPIWSVTNPSDRPVYLGLTGMIGEVPWQGGEGEYSGCIVP